MEFDPFFCQNEREVESKLIVSYLLPALGYQINMWQQEKTMNRFRLDFLAMAHQDQRVIIEAKHPNKNLNNHIEQLRNYLFETEIRYGLLTNGRELRIYENKVHRNCELVFQCFGYGIENKINEIKAIIGKEKLLSNRSTLPKDIHTMKTIAVYHNKGGVGKTTTVVNLAATFSKQGKKVLIIDMDSQANTTFATGLINFGDEEKDNLKDNYVYHLLANNEGYPVSQVARKSRFSNYPIDVIPSHIHLMQHENELNQRDSTKINLLEK
jgi:hypothetical protein